MISAKWFNDWAEKSAFFEPGNERDFLSKNFYIKSVDNYDLV